MHANRHAEDVLRQHDGLFVSGERLALARADDARRFRELLQQAVEQYLSGRPAVAQAMQVSRPSGAHAYELVVRPSTRGMPGADGSLNARVAVFIGSGTGNQRQPEASVEAVQRLFGLTPKEAALALRLAAGRSLLEAARDQGITLNTARAHLRAIYAKTGVERQGTLVRVLLQSVAMLTQ